MSLHPSKNSDHRSFFLLLKCPIRNAKQNARMINHLQSLCVVSKAPSGVWIRGKFNLINKSSSRVLVLPWGTWIIVISLNALLNWTKTNNYLDITRLHSWWCHTYLVAKCNPKLYKTQVKGCFSIISIDRTIRFQTLLQNTTNMVV